MKYLLQLLTLLLCLPGAAWAATTGTQAIGLANWTANDVNRLADDYVQVGGSVEVSFLPFTFNANNPFGNATAFAQSVLPRLQGQLKLTPYLWFHSADPSFEWSAFNPGQDRAAFRSTYLRRVATFDRWAKDLQAWAQQRRLDGKLVIVLCPYLEDNCPNLTAYVNLLNVIRGQQRTDGLSTPMRRSCVGDNIFRVENLPLELHGRYNDVRGHLRNGDVFSNDGNFVWLDAATIPGSRETSRSFTGYGTPTSCGEFIGHQRNALANGISVLYWRPAWNGLPSSQAPANRRNLTPLTGTNGALENYAVLKVMRSR